MEKAGQDDRSNQWVGREPTIHVDSSVKLVTIPGVRLAGNLTQLDEHLLIHPRISLLAFQNSASMLVSC